MDQGHCLAELSAVSMARAIAGGGSQLDQAELARPHFVLRFSAGTTAACALCEAMGWPPSALAAVVAGVLLANIPVAPPLKLGLGLVLIMGVWATFAVTATAL